jgi:membrane protein required for colicin V production
MFIDIIFLLLMLLACIKGVSKGFIVALFSVAAFVVGIAAALKLSAVVATRLEGTFNSSGKWLPVLSFLLVFLAVVVLVKLGAKLVQKSVEFIMLGWLNRLAGVLLYALLYSMLFSVFLFYLIQLHLISTEAVAASKSYPFLQPLGPKLINVMGGILPWFKDVFGQLQHFFEQLPGASNTAT